MFLPASQATSTKVILKVYGLRQALSRNMAQRHDLPPYEKVATSQSSLQKRKWISVVCAAILATLICLQALQTLLYGFAKDDDSHHGKPIPGLKPYFNALRANGWQIDSTSDVESPCKSTVDDLARQFPAYTSEDVEATHKHGHGRKHRKTHHGRKKHRHPSRRVGPKQAEKVFLTVPNNDSVAA